MTRWIFGAALILLPASCALAAGAAAPDWIESSRGHTVAESGHDIAVLFEEEMVDVSRAATRRRRRVAVKVLTTQGRFERPLLAAQSVGEDFKLVGGWRIRPDGDVTLYGPKSIVQYANDDRLSFSMSRMNTFWPDEVRVGDIVGWEVQSRSKPEAYFDSWQFGGPWPTARSRYGLRLPPDWTMRSALRNAAGTAPARDDEGYTVWEMRDVAPVRDEPLRGALESIVPSLTLSYAPEPGRTDAARMDTWQDVARWYAAIVETQAVADEAIRAAAAEITSGAGSRLDGIRALARFVQSIRYLNVAVGRSVAEPHSASSVLSNRFGDCEDKAVLMITLLGAYGVEAWPLVVLTSDDGAVDPEFPAPQQFNHAIVALRPPDGVEVPSVAEAPNVGRLIIFDPTSSDTGFGDLPWYLQGTRGLLAHATAGGLIDLPAKPSDLSARESEARITITDSGKLEVASEWTHRGQYGAIARSYFRDHRGEKLKTGILDDLGSRYGAVEIRKVDVRGIDTPEDPLVVTLDLGMSFPGRQAGSLRMMATRFLFPTHAPILTDEKRTTPLTLGVGYREADRLLVKVPPGWKALDPLPSLKASHAIGEYTLASHRDGDTIVIERELVVSPATVAPGDYPPLRRFFSQVREGDSLALGMERVASP